MTSTQITGQWEYIISWRSEHIETPQSTGENWQMTLYPDSTYSMTGSKYAGVPDVGVYGLKTTLNTTMGYGTYGYGTYISLRRLGSLDSSVYKYRFISGGSLVMDAGTAVDNNIYYFKRR